MTAIREALIGAVRPFQIKGKGFVFDRVTPQRGVRTVRVWGEYRMTLDLANVIYRQIFMGCFGRSMTVWTRALLPAGGAFVDVGAHAGYFTLLAAHLAGPRGRVVAVEPNPELFVLLERHLRVNGIATAQAERLALSDRRGTLRLHLPPAREHLEHNVTFLDRPHWATLDVPCRRLDDCLEDWKLARVDVMKIDIEGAEPRALAGGAERLRCGCVRHLIIEVNGPRLTEAGSSPAALVSQLADLGFVPAKLSGGRAVPVAARTWDLDESHEHDRLFVHESPL